MEPSSNKRGWIRWLDAAALAGMGLGIAFTLLPGWSESLRAGFWTTLAFTVLHIFTSHMNTPEDA